MNIEEVAQETPSEIYKEAVDIMTGNFQHHNLLTSAPSVTCAVNCGVEHTVANSGLSLKRTLWVFCVCMWVVVGVVFVCGLLLCLYVGCCCCCVYMWVVVVVWGSC